MEPNRMPFYECNEHQFVENIRRLLETSERFVVNRKIELRDDAKYGPSILPDQEFDRYTTICTRKSLKSTVLSKVPFIDEFHSRMFDRGQILHGSTSLLYPRMSIPYYRVEYSINVWGGTYFFAFDVLFEPSVTIQKRSGKKIGKGNLVHVLQYNPPKEAVLTINLPRDIIVLDIKNMLRVIEDHSLGF
jgi:hypothetical protein